MFFYQQKLQSHNKLDIDDIVYYFNEALNDEMFREMLQTYKHILVDEVQFLKSNQIDNLFEIAVVLDIPVICYGLRTDFNTNGFEEFESELFVKNSKPKQEFILASEDGMTVVLDTNLTPEFVEEGFVYEDQ